MRLGIFGGTFDPVHLGHLLVAEFAREQGKLDEVWLVPAARPAHKQDAEITPAKQRVEMLQLAAAGHPNFLVSTAEIDREGVSYTVDTLAMVNEARPDAELILIIGADTLADLPNWRFPEQVLQLAQPLVVGRGGEPAPDFSVLEPFAAAENVSNWSKHNILQMPLIELSSTEIRRRVAADETIRYQTPRAVEEYIRSQKVYI
jgi:nicotinate-nucleotide adenylyltransferase